MKWYICICLKILCLIACHTQQAQDQLIGGPCEGCEAIYEYGDMPLSSVDTLPLFHQTEPKLKISGVVYKKDGKTPTKDVIIYIYQTNTKGIYQTRGNETGWDSRHGFIRGWVKSNVQGEYTFYTFRPGAYPAGTEPEHIHMTLKEPDKNEYYIDSIVFNDDSLLTKVLRAQLKNRGGSGITYPNRNGRLYEVSRDIILGKNIPNYE